MGHLHHILTITLYVMHIVGFIWPLRTNYYFSMGTMHREKRLHKSEDKGIMGVQLNVIIFKPNEHQIYVFLLATSICHNCSASKPTIYV